MSLVVWRAVECAVAACMVCHLVAWHWQLVALVGAHGLAPARDTAALLERKSARLGWSRARMVLAHPSVFYHGLSCSDAVLGWCCSFGVASGIALVVLAATASASSSGVHEWLSIIACCLWFVVTTIAASIAAVMGPFERRTDRMMVALGVLMSAVSLSVLVAPSLSWLALLFVRCFAFRESLASAIHKWLDGGRWQDMSAAASLLTSQALPTTSSLVLARSRVAQPLLKLMSLLLLVVDGPSVFLLLVPLAPQGRTAVFLLRLAFVALELACTGCGYRSLAVQAASLAILLETSWPIVAFRSVTGHSTASAVASSWTAHEKHWAVSAMLAAAVLLATMQALVALVPLALCFRGQVHVPARLQSLWHLVGSYLAPEHSHATVLFNKRLELALEYTTAPLEAVAAADASVDWRAVQWRYKPLTCRAPHSVLGSWPRLDLALTRLALDYRRTGSQFHIRPLWFERLMAALLGAHNERNAHVRALVMPIAGEPTAIRAVLYEIRPGQRSWWEQVELPPQQYYQLDVGSLKQKNKNKNKNKNKKNRKR